MNHKIGAKPRALIVGVSGQDGAYLSKFLIDKGYDVFGTSRDLEAASFDGLEYLGVDSLITKMKMIPSDFKAVHEIIASIQPNEIYNLSGQSSVSLSFQQPLEAVQSIVLATINILESIRLIDGNIRFYNAGSGEVFGETQGRPSNEETPFHPVSPYGLAKANATAQVSLHRDVYGLYACTGILFNHESPLRPESYVTQKIIKAAYRIANGSSEKLPMGNIKISRDWGYAPDYVEAMWAMLQLKSPEDFVIATGRTVSLEYFISQAFLYFDLDWTDHVSIDERFFRVSEIMVGAADPRKANRLLGWNASCQVENLIKHMIDHCVDETKG
jgi:GDPmannose 4,6-dehydratase